MLFKEYSVLERLLTSHKHKKKLDNYFIISVQHLLSSTGSMFDAFIRYGFESNNIYLTGKLYSTHSETKEKLKQLGINIIESTIRNHTSMDAKSAVYETVLHPAFWKFLDKSKISRDICNKGFR